LLCILPWMSTPRVPTVRTDRAIASLVPLFALLAACALPAAAMAQQPPATQPIAVDHRSADELLQAARQAARADRNRESADLFALAIARAPQRRRELLREYADQLTYSDRSVAAVPLYRELLTPEPPREERLPILNGLGLALLWSDRPSEARRVYEEIVREQPDNRDAARKLGRAITWSGRQREAVRYLEALLQAHSDDDEARVMLAQARAWMGRNDLARRELRGKAAERDDAKRLQGDLNWATDPRTRLELQHSTQSDNLDITGSRFKQEFSFLEGLGTGELRIEHVDFRLQDGTDGAIVDRIFFRGRYRLGDGFEVNAEAAPERVKPRGSPVDEHLVYSAWLTWWPGDAMRFDLSTSQAGFDNLKSLRLGLLARLYALSTDVTPDERQRYKARVEYADYSDGNQRRAAQVEGEYRVRTHPEIWLGARYYTFRFSQQLDNGYFNPRTFEAAHATAKLDWRPGGDTGRWNLAAYAALGREHAVPDGSQPAYDLSLVSGWRIDARTRVEARAQRFSSRTTGLSGFARNSIGAFLEKTW
jgi:hypothetical protein